LNNYDHSKGLVRALTILGGFLKPTIKCIFSTLMHSTPFKILTIKKKTLHKMLKFWNLVTTKWSKFVHLEIDEIIVNSIKQSTQLWGRKDKERGNPSPS
jgi:hypothetical protein